MANEQAAKSSNTEFSVLASNVSGTETRRVVLNEYGQLQVTIAFGNGDITSTTYDSNQNLTEIVYTNGTNTKTVTFTYDSNNNLSTKTTVIT